MWRVESLWSSVAGSARSFASANANVKLYRTDLQGEITITTRGKENDMTIKTAKETTEDMWAGRTAQKDDSSRSGFIAYGDFGPPPKTDRRRRCTQMNSQICVNPRNLRLTRQMTKSISYSDAGVDIDAATRATDRIKELARRTFNQRTLSEIGSFGGMFDGAFPSLAQPVLVASADGVGTKLKIAFATGVHNTVGRDLVNHCVNDILVQGARPLFFLDYIATGKLSPDVVASIVEGVTNGCRENGCVLLGGETAEMPGFYQDGEYDIAGFIVGVVDREKIIDGKTIAPGDVLLALPSAGLHTNGYSLARKLFFEVAGYEPDTHLPELGMTAGEALLLPHVSYLQPLEGLLDQRSDQRSGPHHRRRTHRQHSAHPSGRHGRARSNEAHGPCRRCSSCCAGSETFRTARCIARSIWASAW